MLNRRYDRLIATLSYLLPNFAAPAGHQWEGILAASALPASVAAGVGMGITTGD